jgi:hypothetical protein
MAIMNLFNKLFNRQPQPNKLTLEANKLTQPITPLPLTDNGATPLAEPMPVTDVIATPATQAATAEIVPAVSSEAAVSDKPKSRFSIKFPLWAKVLALALLFVFLFTLLSTFVGVDLNVVKPYLTGRITSKTTPVTGAVIKLGDTETKTDATGTYRFENLMPGTYELIITADKFEPITTSINISRSYLNYENKFNLDLVAATTTRANGKLIANRADYNFVDDYLQVGDKKFSINRDGTFNFAEIPTGENTWEFVSVNFKDLKEKYTFKAGGNDLGNIVLTPAGDLTANTQSYLTNTTVTNLQVSIEGVAPEQVSISKEGILLIKDLGIDKEYKIKIEHPDYQTRTYAATAKQGVNDIFGFRVVERGRVVFQRRIATVNHLFASDFDGENVVQITKESFNPYAETLMGDQIYFLSPRDNLTSNIGGGNVLLPYVLNINGGNPQRVTSNYQDLGKLVPNFIAKRFVNVRRGENTRARIIEIADLNGESRKAIYTADNVVINDILLAASGQHVAFQVQDQERNARRSGLYWSDSNTEAKRISTRSNILILDISASGNKVLYTTTENGSGITDLYIYTVNTGQDTLVRKSVKGQQYQFLSGSENDLLFFDFRDNASNAYKLTLHDNAEIKLTNFLSGEGVEAVYQQGELILYQTNKGLYVMDRQKLLPNKLVTTSVARYTGYDF